jgi:hypothetical protein
MSRNIRGGSADIYSLEEKIRCEMMRKDAWMSEVVCLGYRVWIQDKVQHLSLVVAGNEMKTTVGDLLAEYYLLFHALCSMGCLGMLYCKSYFGKHLLREAGGRGCGVCTAGE